MPVALIALIDPRREAVPPSINEICITPGDAAVMQSAARYVPRPPREIHITRVALQATRSRLDREKRGENTQPTRRLVMKPIVRNRIYARAVRVQSFGPSIPARGAQVYVVV